MEFEYECNLISQAGDAKSKAMLAIQEARHRNFVQARIYLEEADKSLMRAHKVQKEIITKEARGETMATGVLMIHAQDHLNAATITISYAEEFMEIYTELSALEGKVNT